LSDRAEVDRKTRLSNIYSAPLIATIKTPKIDQIIQNENCYEALPPAKELVIKTIPL
jgi:hypothetical protein